jgi:hypothetical protein
VGERQYEEGRTRHASWLRMLAVLPAAGLVAASFATPALADEQPVPPAMEQTLHVDRFVTVIVDEGNADVSADAVTAPADAVPVEPNVDAVSAENAETPANAPSLPTVGAEPIAPAVADPQSLAQTRRGSDEERRSDEVRNTTRSSSISPEQYHAPRDQYQSGVDISSPRVAGMPSKPGWKRARPLQRKVIPALPAVVRAVSNVARNCFEDGDDSSSICASDPVWNVGWNCRWIPECTRENEPDELPAPVEPGTDGEVDSPECDGEQGSSTRYQPPPGQYQPPFPHDPQSADGDDACEGESNQDPVAVDAEVDDEAVIPGRDVALPQPTSAGADVSRPTESDTEASSPEGAHGAAGSPLAAPPSQTTAAVEKQPLPIATQPPRQGDRPTSTAGEHVETVGYKRAAVVSRPAARATSRPARSTPSSPRPAVVARRPEIDAQLTVLASRQASAIAREQELNVLRLVALGLALSMLAVLGSAAAASVARSGTVAELGSLLRSSGLARGARATRPRGIRYRDP